LMIINFSSSEKHSLLLSVCPKLSLLFTFIFILVCVNLFQDESIRYMRPSQASLGFTHAFRGACRFYPWREITCLTQVAIA